MYTGEVYNLIRRFDYFNYHHERVGFNFESYRNSENKEVWIREFYAKCKVVSNRIAAVEILNKVRAQINGDFWSKTYSIDDETLRNSTTQEEYELCKEYFKYQEDCINRERAEKRLREIRQKQIEEEKRKEKELRERIKAEEIERCLREDGRDTWRLHYLDVHEAERRMNVGDDEFYRGGNVLLRLNMAEDKVETSKSVRINIDVAKKMFKTIQKWHNNPSTFEISTIDTKCSGRYTITSFENDILVAGCHKIAYAEMADCYEKIISLEKVEAKAETVVV
jgi:hypothetical protein